MQPVIKWTGSKRYQARYIVDNFPRVIDTYYEPFIGGGSVLGEYLSRMSSDDSYKCNRIICSDTNEDLINLWIVIKEAPDYLLSEYSKLYAEFAPGDDIKRKTLYNIYRTEYNVVRKTDAYMRRAALFNWILRTCFNGLVRYNGKGDFSTSCHFSRPGIHPDKLEVILKDWSYLLNRFDVQFVCQSYDAITDVKPSDYMYCDPPYADTSTMYTDKFDNNRYFEWLRGITCKYCLSYDGLSGKDDKTYNFPEELYTEHAYIETSASSFKRFVGKETTKVYDSLYIKR